VDELVEHVREVGVAAVLLDVAGAQILDDATAPVGRHHHDRRPGRDGLDQAGEVRARVWIEAQDDDVSFEVACPLDGLDRIGDLSDDAEAGVAVQ
jgi:hypothetical protein